MSSLVRRIQQRLLSTIPFVNDDGEPLSAEERRAIIAIMKRDRQKVTTWNGKRSPLGVRGTRRGTHKRREQMPTLAAEAMRPHPRAVTRRDPTTGRKLGGSASKPSPALPEGLASFGFFADSKNAEPGYRKSIWPAAKIERRR